MSVVIIGGGDGKKMPRVAIPEGTTQLQLNFGTNDLSDMRQDAPALAFAGSDDSVATVDGDGVVTKVGAGRVVFTCTASRGDYTHVETVELVFYGDSADFLTYLDVQPA